MCCACDGSCNHIGPHAYCPAHGGQTTYGRTFTTAGVNAPGYTTCRRGWVPLTPEKWSGTKFRWFVT